MIIIGDNKITSEARKEIGSALEALPRDTYRDSAGQEKNRVPNFSRTSRFDRRNLEARAVVYQSGMTEFTLYEFTAVGLSDTMISPPQGASNIRVYNDGTVHFEYQEREYLLHQGRKE